METATAVVAPKILAGVRFTRGIRKPVPVLLDLERPQGPMRRIAAVSTFWAGKAAEAIAIESAHTRIAGERARSHRSVRASLRFLYIFAQQAGRAPRCTGHVAE